MTRHVYHVEYIGNAGIDDMGIYGTLRRARAAARHETCTRKEPQTLDHIERWFAPESVAGQRLDIETGQMVYDLEEFVQITRRPVR